MKKRICFVAAIIVLVLTSACASAQVPTPTEPAAVEYPMTATEVPPHQTSGQVKFVYEYTNVIPKDWIVGNETREEILRFRWEGGQWSTETATPVIRDMGPLFPTLIWEYPIKVRGACGIDTYFENQEEWNGKISFHPVNTCDRIEELEEVRMTFGLNNCNRDSVGNLDCSLETDKGWLFYKLNPGLDKFQFTYDGVWNFEYENWIRESLGVLGFKPIAEDFFNDMFPGAGKTLYKK